MNTIAIIDYGMGNLHSVAKAVEHVAPDARVLVTDNVEQIREADRIILPGVGAIRDCMAEICRLGFDQLVKEVAQDRPLLGICVGMQALMAHSEENDGVDCIGLFPGKVRFFGGDLADLTGRLKVPHMGWNQVAQLTAHPLWHSIPDNERFYFVHSYYVDALTPADGSSDNSYIHGRTEYGKSIAAAVGRDNIFAVQFHPEKSQHAGLTLLRNFSRWNGRL